MPKGGTVHSGGYGRPPAKNTTAEWFKNNRTANLQFGAETLGAYGDYTGTMVRARARVADAAWNRFDSERQARQMRENATQVRAAGARESTEIQYQGRVVESDAIAAMAAQGGVMDPVMLAKIKQRVDYNSLMTIFDANRTASGIESQARATEGAGRLNYLRAKEQKKVDRYAARSNLFSQVAFSAAKAYGG